MWQYLEMGPFEIDPREIPCSCLWVRELSKNMHLWFRKQALQVHWSWKIFQVLRFFLMSLTSILICSLKSSYIFLFNTLPYNLWFLLLFSMDSYLILCCFVIVSFKMLLNCSSFMWQLAELSCSPNYLHFLFHF